MFIFMDFQLLILEKSFITGMALVDSFVVSSNMFLQSLVGFENFTTIFVLASEFASIYNGISGVFAGYMTLQEVRPCIRFFA